MKVKKYFRDGRVKSTIDGSIDVSTGFKGYADAVAIAIEIFLAGASVKRTQEKTESACGPDTA